MLKKLLDETSKFSQCVFISFKHINIYNLLKIKSTANVGLSFSPPTSVKIIIKKSNNKKIDCLILDKFFLKNKNIQDLKIKKYYYTIKTKSEFSKYSKNNNYENAMIKTHTSIGYALYYTTLTIIVGFSILIFSNFIPSIYFGLMTSLSMFIALFATLIIVTKLLSLFITYN